MKELLEQNPGKKTILLGNEAIIRGAIESGVQYVSTYPGTPASEIGNIFFEIHKANALKDFYFEFANNEKTALESGVGASYSGLKTLVAMKNFGMNVCSEVLIPFCYTGTVGPTVIMVADDPSCYSSSQSEENSRPFAYLTHIPVLEPSTVQECKDFTKLAFELSEKFKMPIMIRTTTRASHQKGIITLGKIAERKGLGHKFVKNPRNFVTLPPRVLEMKQELLDKVSKIQALGEKLNINQIIPGSKKIGIITSGVSYLYVLEALEEFKIDLPVLKLGFFHPLPEQKIKNFLKKVNKVLVVEELEPFLEKEITRIAKDSNPKVQIIGKELIPAIREVTPEIVLAAVAKVAGKKYSIPACDVKFLKRLPQLCAGCPYWLVFGGVKKAVNEKEVIFGGDIGCYQLAGYAPLFIHDYLICMGSSIGIAHGVSKATKQKVIAFIGDGTFFHSGLLGLVNAIYNKSNPLLIILENQITAMTGHQPHPGYPEGPGGIKIEEVVRSLGVKNLKTIDPINQEEFISTVKDFVTKDEVSVIIAKRACIQIKKKN